MSEVVSVEYQIQRRDNKHDEWWDICGRWASLEVAREVMADKPGGHARWAKYRIVKYATTCEAIE